MHQEDEFVQCPYYGEERDKQILCEGVEKGSILRLCFGNSGQKRRYKARLCRAKWPQCRLARMLNEKYDYTP